jgi:hypothetical protein
VGAETEKQSTTLSVSKSLDLLVAIGIRGAMLVFDTL